MDASEFDVGSGAAQAAPDLLKQIQQKLDEAIKLSEAVEQMESDLSATKQALHALRTVQLPDLMARANMPSTTLGDHVVEIADLVSGSLPKDPAKRLAAMSYLKELKADGMIKTELSLAFGKEQRKEAETLAEKLQAEGFTVDMESNVNAQTLCAWARERIKKGEPIDPERLGLFVGKVAKIDLSKEAKKRNKQKDA